MASCSAAMRRACSRVVVPPMSALGIGVGLFTASAKVFDGSADMVKGWICCVVLAGIRGMLRLL